MSNRYLEVKLRDHVEVRDLLPSDAIGVIDLLWRCYGYTYRGAGEDIYDPDDLAAALIAGRFSGFIAATRSNEVTGVVCHREIRPGEIEVFGLAVDPTRRGHGVGQRLSDRVREYVFGRTIHKAVMSAVTRHPLAQRVIHAFEILPCSLQLGVHPPLLGFRGMERSTSVLRDTLLFGVRLFGDDWPTRAVYVPEVVRPLAQAIYRTHRLTRTFATPEATARDARPKRTRFHIDLNAAWLTATMRLERPGADAVDRIGQVLRDLQEGFVEHLELRVPLDDPWILDAYPALRKLGLVVSGLEPEVAARDELCLVWVRRDRVELEQIQLVHPTAKALLAAIPRAPPAPAGGPAPSPAPASAAADADAPRARPARSAPPRVAPPARRADPLPPPLLHARLQAARQLASGLMHEINNPLNIILGSAYSLRTRLQQAAPDPKAVTHSLDAIEGEVQRVARLLRQLQRFCDASRKEGGSVDLHEAVRDAVALVRGVAAAREVELALEPAPDLPRVSGRAPDLEQAVIQLALNAIEASRPGAQIRVWAERRADQVAIVLEDRGSGIAPEILPRVTEPFFTTKEAGAGVGLGLSIAASVAETHGGRLEIQSRPGEGTRVSLVLPTSSRPAPAQGGQERAAESAPLRPPPHEVLEKGTP